MNRYQRFALMIVTLVLLAACGTEATAQQEPATPTPLPPDPALERPTYTVQRGPIERILEINGRVTPVDLVRLSFHRPGQISRVNIRRGDVVKSGDVLAELLQDDEIAALREAEDALVAANRELEQARKQHARAVQEAQLALSDAQDQLKLLLPGGDDDPIRKAQKELEQAQRELNTARDGASEGKTSAEYALLQAAEALQDAQKAYDKAFWNVDWVERYGTDPNQPTTVDPETGKEVPNKLTDAQKEDFRKALVSAERALRDAERSVVQAQRALDKAREQETTQNQDAEARVQDAQRKLDRLLTGNGNKELLAARRAVQDAQIKLDELRQEAFNTQLKAIESAQRNIEKARKKVEDGRIIAPQDGEAIAVAINEGDQAQPFEQLIEIADPSRLEIATELGGDQMRQLAEGQPSEVSLLARPDVIMPATIRLLPAPYGSGGSGAVQEQDRTTRFQITDTKGQELTPGAVAKIRIVLQRKENVLWLPPDAVRAFEGRRFVVVRQGDRERRAPVKVGIVTDDRVEIIEGVKEGDVVIGQ